MPDQPKPESYHEQSKADANSSTNPVVIAPAPTEVHSEAPALDQEEPSKKKTYFAKRWEAHLERKNDPFRERASWTDKAIVFLTCGIVFLGILQVKEMIDSGTQTDKIITAANGIQTSQGQLVLDNKQVLADNRKALSAVLGENRKELGLALGQNREALKAQTAAANSQTKSIQDQTVIDEQPWVGIDQDLMVEKYSVTDASGRPNFAGTIGLKNFGKTPALRVDVAIVAIPIAEGDKPVRGFSKNMAAARDSACLQAHLYTDERTDIFSGDTVFPGKPFQKEFKGLSTIGGSSLVGTDLTPASYPVFVGCIAYFDRNDTIHYTRFAYSPKSMQQPLVVVPWPINQGAK